VIRHISALRREAYFSKTSLGRKRNVFGISVVDERMHPHTANYMNKHYR
jgi:hypothetical protein